MCFKQWQNVRIWYFVRPVYKDETVYKPMAPCHAMLFLACFAQVVFEHDLAGKEVIPTFKGNCAAIVSRKKLSIPCGRIQLLK